MTETASTLPRCRVCGGPVRQFDRRGAQYGRCGECLAITRLLSEQAYRALEVTYDPDPLVALRDADALRVSLQVELNKQRLREWVQPRRAERVLDIGCGQGGFLIAARDLGLDVVGIEPSKEHSRAAREVFGLDVKEGYFGRGSFPEESFDIVILSHVIEHTYDPNAFLADALGVLRPSGRLVVVTPNAASNIARLSGRFWTMLKPIDHVSLLSEESMRRIPALRGMQLRFRTMEYRSEPLAALVAAARDAVLETVGRQRRSGGPPFDVWRQRGQAGVTATRWWRKRLAGRVLELAATPLYLADQATDGAGCLVAVATKPG